MIPPHSTTTIEREARFLVREAAVHETIARLRFLNGFCVVSRRRERQRNTYVDTEDLRLTKRRAILKVREIGHRVEVIFKQSLGYRNGIAERLEVATSIRPTQLREVFSNQLDIAPLRRVQAIVGVRPITQICTVWTDRSRLLLAHNAERVEVDVDRVAVREGQRIRASRLEVEVENVNASTAVFTRVLTALRGRFGASLRPLRVSKYEFGLQQSNRRLAKAVADLVIIVGLVLSAVSVSAGSIETAFLEQPWPRQWVHEYEVGKYAVRWRQKAKAEEGIFAGASFAAEATLQRTWALATDYTDLGTMTPGVERVRWLERTPTRQVIQISVKVLWKTLQLTFEIEQDPPKAVRFRLLNPELGEYRGVCLMQQEGTTTRVDLATWLKPAIPVSGGLVLWVERIVLLRGIRNFLETCERAPTTPAA